MREKGERARADEREESEDARSILSQDMSGEELLMRLMRKFGKAEHFPGCI